MHTTQVVSYSSIEHDGLGRYGDALNPRGDLDEMRRLAALLNPSGLCPAHPPPRTPPTAGAPRADRRGGAGAAGLLLLGVPVGRDALVFNAHRIYGPRRLALLYASGTPSPRAASPSSYPPARRPPPVARRALANVAHERADARVGLARGVRLRADARGAGAAAHGRRGAWGLRPQPSDAELGAAYSCLAT